MSFPEQLQQSDRLDPLVWKITSVAVIGSFLSQLDATVVNVSLSTLAVELHSSLSSILNRLRIFVRSKLLSLKSKCTVAG
jgi:hypothetical protein